MRNLISVAVIVTVAFTVAGLKLRGKEVQFGDIIASPPKCLPGVTYQHFAVYVGDKVPGQKGNIFEHTKHPVIKVWPACIFSELESSDDHYVFNFLDGYKGEYTKGSEKEMMERINAKHAKCEFYNPFKNNCEQLATYVRYGRKVSIQFNGNAGRFCKVPPGENKEEMWKYVTEGSECQVHAASSNG